MPLTKENFFRLNLLTTYYGQTLSWEHKKYMKKYKFKNEMAIGTSHYRYDFVAYKEGRNETFLSKLLNRTNRYYAIEVKTNSSDLNTGQKIRLGLMKRYGFNAQVINVIINDNQIENAINNGVYEYDDIIIKDDFGLSKVKFFNIKDFREIVQDTYYFNRDGGFFSNSHTPYGDFGKKYESTYDRDGNDTKPYWD